MQYLRERWWPGPIAASVAAIIAVVGPIEAYLLSASEHPFSHALLTLTAALAIFGRRVFPLGTLLICFVVVGMTEEFTHGDGTFAAVLGAAAAAINCGYELRRPWIYFSLPTILAFTSAAAAVGFGANIHAIDVIAITVLYGGAIGGGFLFRQRHEQAEALRALAAQLEAERELRAQEAVEAERVRIARELHDIVSHSISLIVIQLQAVRRRVDSQQPQTAGDLRAIETVARQAMAEMRRMLGVLRVQGGALELEPQPGLGQLARLVEQTRSAGLDVDLRICGEPEPLPPGVDLAGYRIVQEALTNVLKHAGRSTATVTLTYGDRELMLEVVDDGQGPVNPREGGAGLIGMRERVAIYGGTFEFGPAKPRGFRVAARLPVREEALRD